MQAVEYLRERQEVVLLDTSLQADLDAVHALRALPGIGDGEISVGPPGAHGPLVDRLAVSRATAR